MLPTTAGATYGDADDAGEGVEHGGMEGDELSELAICFGGPLTRARRHHSGVAEGRRCRRGPTRPTRPRDQKERDEVENEEVFLKKRV